MKKADLINSICEMQPNIPRTLLSKKDFPKVSLENLYKRLVNGQDYADLLDEDLTRKKSRRKPKEKEKKKIKIIEFSDSDLDDEEPEKVEEKKQKPEKVEEELPQAMPQLIRQNAEPVVEPVVEKKPKLNKIKVKKEIKELLIPFIREVKDLVLEYKGNKDKDYLEDNYNILLRDIEEIYQEYLENIEADDSLYNYVADLLSVHTGKIERLLNA